MTSAVERERLKGVCEGALGRDQVAKLSATLWTGSRVHVVGAVDRGCGLAAGKAQHVREGRPG